MWHTWAPESQWRGWKTNCDISRLMSASVHLYLSWEPVLHCKCCKNSLVILTWSKVGGRPVPCSPYLSKCFRRFVKEKKQKQIFSSLQFRENCVFRCPEKEVLHPQNICIHKQRNYGIILQSKLRSQWHIFGNEPIQIYCCWLNMPL